MLEGVEITLQWESIILVIVDREWRRKKYRVFLVNIKKPHCYENVTAKLKSWNHTCLVRPYRSVYKLMWSNELRLREYVKLNTQCQWKHNSKIYWRMSFCPDISINTIVPETPVMYLYCSPWCCRVLSPLSIQNSNSTWKLPERLAFCGSSSRLPLRDMLFYFFSQKVIVLKRDLEFCDLSWFAVEVSCWSADHLRPLLF